MRSLRKRKGAAPAAVGYAVESDLSLLSDLKGIIDFDPKIPYGAFEFSMHKQQLNCSAEPEHYKSATIPFGAVAAVAR